MHPQSHEESVVRGELRPVAAGDHQRAGLRLAALRASTATSSCASAETRRGLSDARLSSGAQPRPLASLQLVLPEESRRTEPRCYQLTVPSGSLADQHIQRSAAGVLAQLVTLCNP